MDQDSFPIIFGGLMGLLAGIIGSLIAPWVHWGIEKRKTKRKERIQLLDELRSTVKIQGKEFLASKNYIRIRPFLSTKLTDIIESPDIYHVSKDKNRISKLNSEFLMELDAVEIEWSLGIGNGKNRKKKYYNPDWAGMQITEITNNSGSD